jgi:hypothetical protein
MAVEKELQLVVDREFCPRQCRHSINGTVYVLHCHHYATLYSQLADDLGMLDGKALLAASAEETFHAVLTDYFAKHGIDDIADRISIGQQYFGFTGLGTLEVTCLGPESGEARMPHSHVDEGWVKKWGSRETPVNFIGCGFIAALFAAAYDRPKGSYSVSELTAIVAGADCSTFQVVAR